MRALIRTDQPFRGFIQSLVTPDGKVQYTDMTPDEYAADRGFPVRVVEDDEFKQMFDDYEASLITEPVEETEDDFDYALGVLPPCKWQSRRGVEMFHISERIYGSIVHWHCRFDGRFFSINDRSTADPAAIADKIRAIP